MKKLLPVALAGLILLSIATMGDAATPDPYVHKLERKLAWSTQHIKQLNARRSYLHVYIGKLRQRSQHPTFVISGGFTGGGRLTASQVAGYARGAGFPEYVVGTMVSIADRESGLCPRAVYGYGCNEGGTTHGSNACGLWQLYPCPGPQALDPATNARLAYQKYRASGLAPWS